MKIAIISDVHSNLAALESFPEKDYDQLWCLGDLVDYGPNPHEATRWVKEKATTTVRGNHDHAVGFDVDPKCSPPFRRLAEETKQFTREVCAKEDLAFLRNLPVQKEVMLDRTRFFLVHAIPTDPLFGYCPGDSEQWAKEVEWIRSDVLLVGHTHTPFIHKVGNTTVVNPGSLGQPKTGRPLACYAVWEDGKIFLKEYAYPIVRTIESIRAMPISSQDQDSLITLLGTGSPPKREVAV